MILVTGANGQVGRAVIQALLSKGEQVRAFVFTSEDSLQIQKLGKMEVVIGDMSNKSVVHKAFKGVDKVYHICSVFNEQEVEIGQMALEAAKANGVSHFVFHSVLHSVIQDLPHHQKKLMVEELIVNSGLPYTIIQPAVFMQNIMESWKSIEERGVFIQNFFSVKDTKMCLLDLKDLAEAVSIILTTPGFTGATYELCGPENLTKVHMKSALEQNFNRKIKVEFVPYDILEKGARERGLEDYQVSSFLKMFQHYNDYDFLGNSKVITWILGRKPISFAEFITRSNEERSRKK